MDYEIVRHGRFTYSAWRGTNYPWSKYLGATGTRRGARRLIRKDKARLMAGRAERNIVETIKGEEA